MSKIDGAMQFTGPVSFSGQMYPPNGFAGNNHFSSDANQRLAASKAEHQFTVSRTPFGPTTAISAITELLHIVRGATGSVVDLEAAVVTKATGADREVSIDLQKSTSGGAFATILSTPLVFDDSSTDRTAVAATVSSASLVAGDILQVVISVAGVADAQALGLILTLNVREQPE